MPLWKLTVALPNPQDHHSARGQPSLPSSPSPSNPPPPQKRDSMISVTRLPESLLRAFPTLLGVRRTAHFRRAGHRTQPPGRVRARPSQRFTPARCAWRRSWLPRRAARWEIGPSRGATPGRGPQRHPPRPSRLGLTRAAGEGAGGGGGSYWPRRPLRGVSAGPDAPPPDLTMGAG